MRVVQINKYYWPPVGNIDKSSVGGIEVSVRLLAEELVKIDGLEVNVLVCHDNSPTKTELISGVKVIRCTSNATLFSMPVSSEFMRYMGSLEANILHFHHPFPPGELAYLIKRPDAKVVMTWHSDIVRQRVLSIVYRPMLKLFLSKVDRILVTSPNYLRISRYLEPFRSKCRVVPLGIDPDRGRLTEAQQRYAQNLRAKYGPRIVLFVGRLKYYKGVEYLVEAMQSVTGQLVIVGNGPTLSELLDRASGLRLSGRVHFHTDVGDDELAAYYAACDVFVLPSIAYNEAFGLVQVEAMLFGKPVISTDLPTGVTFVNQHEKTGLVVPSRNPKALAAALNRLLQDSELRWQLGAAARQRVLNLFTKQRMAQQVFEVYGELLG